MRETRVVISDDVIFHETGERVDADDHLEITVKRRGSPAGKLGGGAGLTFAVDLTEANGAEFDKLILRYAEAAGRAPGVRPEGAPRRSGPQKNAALRAFCDLRAIKYRTPAGHVYYSEDAKRAYAAYLAEGGTDAALFEQLREAEGGGS